VLVPKPRDWTDRQHITGYWFLPPAAPDWKPPEALTAFLAAGSPPVYVSASSLHDDRTVLRELLTSEPRRRGCRLIA
jgi:sterol 3beta-glucosyltransferase